MGGGKFVVPVQRVTDFLQGMLSGDWGREREGGRWLPTIGGSEEGKCTFFFFFFFFKSLFLFFIAEGPLPSSSYRLGVKSAPLHQIYPPRMTEALREGLRVFERQVGATEQNRT